MDSSAQLDVKDLAYIVQDEKLILVLGPGASTIIDDGHEAPLQQRLSRSLSATSGISTDDLDPNDLRLVSQVWYERRKSLTGLQRKVLEFYKSYNGQTTQLHRNLAVLPFKLCITTSPDDFLFTAFEEAGKHPVREFYNFKAARSVDLPEPSIDKPLIYHLYGHPQSLDSLVITENDLIDFLTTVIRNDPPLPSYIRKKLASEDSACLFFDLEFKNWYLRVLMNVLGYKQQHNNASWAIEDPDFFAKSKQHQSIVYFSSLQTINFHQESLLDFSSRLSSAYEEIKSTIPQQSLAKPPASAPLVFLSYASEDRSLVTDLYSQLEAEGIRVWLDVDNLRGGDKWDIQLQHVIGKLANYVVFVQTPNMFGRDSGVFNSELKEALKRETELTRGRFLIPVHSAANCLMPQIERERLHSVSVRTTDDVGKLADTIREDWNARSAFRPAAAAAAL
jgi:hypothetical protein